MIQFSIFNLLFTIWFDSFAFFTLNVSIPRFSYRKRFELTIKYLAKIDCRERYWKIWNEASQSIVEDDDLPF